MALRYPNLVARPVGCVDHCGEFRVALVDSLQTSLRTRAKRVACSTEQLENRLARLTRPGILVRREVRDNPVS
jgi:DNA-binding HxlR family transcriptional regulator